MNAILDPHRFPAHAATGTYQHLRLLTFNIQVGIAAHRPHHYVTHSWKHVLPHPTSFDNLDRIADLVADYDIVALQEADAGSLRSYFVNQVEYLAHRGQFPYWYHQTNRNLGKIAQHSNGLLSRIRPTQISDYKLPGFIPGRGAIMARYGTGEAPLILLLVHLALSRRARMRQIDFLTRIINEHEHVVVMGDFNCQPRSVEMDTLLRRTGLCEPVQLGHTFPSWRPARNIDHILITPSLAVTKVQVLDSSLSDHLPIALEVKIPETMRLSRT